MDERPKTRTPVPKTKPKAKLEARPAKPTSKPSTAPPTSALGIKGLRWRGERLRTLMDREGYNNNRLARRLEVHPSGPQRWTELGMVPETEVLIALTLLFRVPITFFFGLPEGVSSREAIAELIRNTLGEDEAEVIESMGNMPKDRRSLLLELARHHRRQ